MYVPVAQWLGRLFPEQEIEGSNPSGDVFDGPTCQSCIPVGVVGNIRACHARARGSIPRSGAHFLVLKSVSMERLPRIELRSPNE